MQTQYRIDLDHNVYGYIGFLGLDCLDIEREVWDWGWSWYSVLGLVGGEVYSMDSMARMEEEEALEGYFGPHHHTRQCAGRAVTRVSSNTLFIGSHAALVSFVVTRLDCSTHILCVEPRTHAHWVGYVCCWWMDFCFHARTPSRRFTDRAANSETLGLDLGLKSELLLPCGNLSIFWTKR